MSIYHLKGMSLIYGGIQAVDNIIIQELAYKGWALHGMRDFCPPKNNDKSPGPGRGDKLLREGVYGHGHVTPEPNCNEILSDCVWFGV